MTYNNVLDILGCSGHGDEMLCDLAYMEEVDIVPDFISFSAAFEGLEDLMCLLYLRKRVESGVEPDLLTYAALVDSFDPSGNVEASLKLFRQMKMTKIHPSIYIYRSLITNLSRAGKFQLATGLSDEVNSPSTCQATPEDFKPKGRLQQLKG